MASYPPPPVPPPPPGYDPRSQRRYLRDQARAQRDAYRAQRDAYRAQRDAYRAQMRSMRRGSVLGPILLLGVGVLFLLLETGHMDYHRFWGWYGHWWPLLLVGAGVIVLAEWAFDQFNLRDPQLPAYRRTLGGGVGLLLLFLIFTGIAAGRGAGLHPFQNGWFNGTPFGPDSLDELLGDKHESDQMLDLALPVDGSLSVVNPRGDVTVGASEDGRIHIAIHKQVYARTDSDADSRAQQLSPHTGTDGSQVTLTVPALEGARADLLIQAPAAAALSINANRGDIHVAAIKAPVSVTANHGDIELSAITGQTTARINSGGSSLSAHNLGSGIAIQGRAQDVTLVDVTGPVSLSGEFFGTAHFEHINGSIHFHTSRTDLQLARLDGEIEISPHSDLSADQALGPVVLTTSNRDITLDRVAGDIAVTNKNGTIDVTAAPALGNITLEDRNGSVKTTLPEHASFSVQATTTDGDAHSDFPLTTSDGEDRKSINGNVGAGGPLVRITTSNGDISIHKGDVPPVPPQAPAPPKITLVPQPPATPAKKH